MAADAGAYFIRKGLVSPLTLELFLQAIGAADGGWHKDAGGTHEKTLQVCFQEPWPEGPAEDAEGPEWWTKATFHIAALQVDAILSYPWMNTSSVGLFPHLEAFARFSGADKDIQVDLLHGFPEEGWSKKNIYLLRCCERWTNCEP